MTIEDGLSYSTVNVCFQDRNGFMWFGTERGLCVLNSETDVGEYYTKDSGKYRLNVNAVSSVF